MDVAQMLLTGITGEGHKKAERMLLATKTGILNKVNLMLKDILVNTPLLLIERDKVRKEFIKQFSTEILKLETK